jgi:hypothetical protein
VCFTAFSFGACVIETYLKNASNPPLEYLAKGFLDAEKPPCQRLIITVGGSSPPSRLYDASSSVTAHLARRHAEALGA